ncbi:MAG TPA: hypothetical protein PLC35_10505 [Methanosarcina vacuolata]|nr:hypothetical protein [Methanosarcina vacuolata]
MPFDKKITKIPDRCPHCHEKLSPWQQVLLNVDRAIICKNCWYRIILDVPQDEEDDSKTKENK